MRRLVELSSKGTPEKRIWSGQEQELTAFRQLRQKMVRPDHSTLTLPLSLE
jgi:hypothetical protein